MPDERFVLDDIINISFSRCRGFGLKPSKLDHPEQPLLQTAHQLYEDPDRPATSTALDAYYGTFRPASAADVLGLPQDHPLSWHHPLGAVFPWNAQTPWEQEAALWDGILGYYAQHNCAHWRIGDGHTQFGPVSLRKLELEIWRITRLFESIREEGYDKKNHPPILGAILVDDRTGDWVCDIKDGLHRIAACHVMGWRSLPVRIIGETTVRSEYRQWPGVHYGLFTPAEALQIFDAYFEGKLPMAVDEKTKKKAEELAQLSVELHELGEYDKADQALDESLKLVPSNHISYAPAYDFQRKKGAVVQNLTNYARAGRSDTARQIFPNYYTLNLDGERIEGQRDPQDRLQYIADLDAYFGGKTVLDIGGNQGGMLFALSDVVESGVGIDFDNRLINAANRISHLHFGSQFAFYTFNLEDDPLELIKDLIPNGHVDVVMLLSVCPHIRNWREVIQFAASISDAMLFEANGHEHEQLGQLRQLDRMYPEMTVLAGRGKPGIGSRRLIWCQK